MDEFAFSGSRGGWGSRLWKKAMVLGAVMALVSSGFALAEVAQADGDTAVSSLNPSVTDCSTEHVFTGSLKIDYQGGSHFAAGAALTLSVAPDAAATAAGITASGPSNTTLPGVWTTGSSHTVTGYSTTVPAGTDGDTYKITYGVSGPKSTSGTIAIDDFFNVNVECASAPTNTAPTVNADTDPVTVDEGDLASNTGTYEDADDDDVTLTASVGSVIDNENGTWSWSFATTDGPAESQTVTITADDGTDTGSVDFGLTVDNVAPDVAASSFSDVSIDCRSSVDLTGISFSDPGVNDADWNVNVNFGDGSDDVNYDSSTQGAQSDQSHTYDTPGTYTATVDVTDKDGDGGSTASSNPVVVNQVYRVDFRPPFDDSTPSGLIVNTMKSGRTVPVKATIFDVCTDRYVTDPAAVRIAVSTASGATGSSFDSVEHYADSGSSNAGTSLFRWSTDASVPGGGFWIYNLDSRNAIGGSPMAVNQLYRVNIYVGSVLATASDWALVKPVK